MKLSICLTILLFCGLLQSTNAQDTNNPRRHFISVTTTLTEGVQWKRGVYYKYGLDSNTWKLRFGLERTNPGRFLRNGVLSYALPEGYTDSSFNVHTINGRFSELQLAIGLEKNWMWDRWMAMVGIDLLPGFSQEQIEVETATYWYDEGEFQTRYRPQTTGDPYDLAYGETEISYFKIGGAVAFGLGYFVTDRMNLSASYKFDTQTYFRTGVQTNGEPFTGSTPNRIRPRALGYWEFGLAFGI